MKSWVQDLLCVAYPQEKYIRFNLFLCSTSIRIHIINVNDYFGSLIFLLIYLIGSYGLGLIQILLCALNFISKNIELWISIK